MKVPFLSLRARVLSMLIISAACILACGTQYTISAWSPQLKKQLNCTQGEIAMIGMLGGMSSYLSPLAGVLVYALPEWLVSVVVMGCSVLGYIFMALAVRSRPGEAFHPLRNTSALGTLNLVQNFGSVLLYKMLLVVNVNNMPKHRRGSAVALLAAVLGISASVFTLLYNGPLHSSVEGVLLVMGITMMCVSVVGALLARRIDPVDTWGAELAGVARGEVAAVEKPMLSHHGSFMVPHDGTDGASGDAYRRMSDGLDEEMMYGNAHTKTMAVNQKPPLGTGVATGTGVLLVPSLAASDSFVAPPFEPHFDTDEDRLAYEAGKNERAQLAYQARVCGGGMAGQVFGAVGFLMRHAGRPYWFMVCIFVLCVGAGSMQINQTGHIVQALNDGEQDGNLTTILILILSAASTSGRLLMALTDVVPIRKGWWLVGVCTLMSLTHFANAFIFTEKHLVVCGVIGVGLAYGALVSILPILVGDFFGSVNFSMNLGWTSFASGLGGLFTNHMAGKFYDRHVIPGSHECVGSHCFRDGFILCGSISAFAVLFALALVPGTQRGRRRVSGAVVKPAP